MGITISAVNIRHERRITLVFSESLAAGAFTNTAFYTFTSNNGVGGPPGVLAVIPIPYAPNTCDLALDTDLAGGGSYSVSAVGVPGVDATVTPAGSTLSLFFGIPPNDTNVEVQTIDLDALIFGTDLIWTGADYLETANGDLASQAGIPVFQADMQRRLSSDTPVQWDRSWGLQGGDAVNTPSVLAASLKGRLLRQINADNRTGPGATVTVTQSPTDPSAQNFTCQIPPKGASDAIPVNAVVPIP